MDRTRANGLPTRMPKASNVTVTQADGSQVVLPPYGRQNLRSSLQRSVFARDGQCCRYCGYKHGSVNKFHVDHVVPVSMGGMDILRNLVVACRQCNVAKGTKTWTPLTVDHAKSIKRPIPLELVLRRQGMQPKEAHALARRVIGKQFGLKTKDASR